MSETVTVEVGESEPAAVPAAPAVTFVTPGELDARLSLMESSLRGSIGEAVDAAFAARRAAEDAEEQAAAAQVTADAAAELAAAAVVAEAAAELAEGEGEAEPAGPHAPEPREDAPVETAPPKPAPRPGYGARWLSGHRR